MGTQEVSQNNRARALQDRRKLTNKFISPPVCVDTVQQAKAASLLLITAHINWLTIRRMPKIKNSKSALSKARELFKLTKVDSDFEESSPSDDSEEYSHIPGWSIMTWLLQEAPSIIRSRYYIFKCRFLLDTCQKLSGIRSFVYKLQHLKAPNLQRRNENGKKWISCVD